MQKTLDEHNALYFTEESFDDFYYGKGSTYPDVNGGVGILFEQASSRGHLQETINGPLSFPFTIKNQLLTSLSTFQAAIDNRTDLLDYQAKFYNKALILLVMKTSKVMLLKVVKIKHVCTILP